MSLSVCNAAGETVQLEETPFAQGGEAAVHDVVRFPGVVVKLYHPRILQSRADTLRRKIEAMTGSADVARFKKGERLAWPRFSVFDASGKWRGYAMRKATGVPMTRLAHAMAYREHFPRLDRAALVDYILSLLGTIQELHDAKVLVGDYNPANFLCHTQAQTVTLIDCDSWQVSTTAQTFRCPVTVPDMMAPELLGKDLNKVTRTPQSEYFSLAILLFKMLMLGRHPFDAIGGQGPVENIRRGYFPYGVGAGGIPKGPWYNIWSHMPFKIKEQFIRTFKDGCTDPAERTSVAEWLDLFGLYRREMVERGWHEKALCPAQPKKADYRGKHSTSQPCPA